MINSSYDDELIDILDDEGNIIGSKMKSQAHRDGSWHMSAHAWIIQNGKIMLQKRASTKDFFPGRYDVSCAGHVKSGESCEDAMVRELNEELGLRVSIDRLENIGKRKQVSFMKERGLVSKEIISIFLLRLGNEIIDFNTSEICEIRLFGVGELKELLLSCPDIFVDDTGYLTDMADKISGMIS